MLRFPLFSLLQIVALIIFVLSPVGLNALSLAERIGIPQKTWDRLMSSYQGKDELEYYKDLVLWRGTHYQIGKLQANYYLKYRNPLYQDFLYDLIDEKKNINEVLSILPNALSKDDAKEYLQSLKKWFPDQVEEYRGFADQIGIPLINLVQILGSLVASSGCSSVGISGTLTQSGHTIVGRNYDFHPAIDEKVLAFTQPKDKLAVLGNVAGIFGRYDGVNEKGLFVSMSVSIDRPKGRLFFFGFVIRHLLENASTTEEAVALLKKIPHRDSYNYIVVDRDNAMAVVETRREKVRVRHPANEKQFMISTNHYQHPDMLEDNQYFLPNSLIRYKNLNSVLERKKSLSANGLAALLSTDYENDGAQMRHYQPYFFGTLYTYVADLETLKWEFKLGGDHKFEDISMMDFKDQQTEYNIETGFMKRYSTRLINLIPSLEDYADLDWYASPENQGFKINSLFGASINPIGVMLENRIAYRFPTGSPVWSPYFDLGGLQLLTPVFHRHGIYLRWSSKSIVDAEIGYERHVGFKGLEAIKEGGKYKKIEVEKKLEESDTVYFETDLWRFSLQLHQSFGFLVVLNYLDYYRWGPSIEIKAFYNFETGLTHEFGEEIRNNLMLLLPLGGFSWQLGGFYQTNVLLDEAGYTQFTGSQFNYQNTERAMDIIVRVGHHNHDESQQNATDGLGLQFLIKKAWR